jgi:hypothetical protein
VFILSLILSSCGFKQISKKNSELIYIQNIKINDEQRIAYNLKNDILLISDLNSKNKYDVEVKIEKRKKNKIRDKTGSITRYQILVNASLQLTNLNGNKKTEKVFLRNGDYDVTTIHSNTINAEKYLIKNLTQQISEDIVNFITLMMRNK